MYYWFMMQQILRSYIANYLASIDYMSMPFMQTFSYFHSKIIKRYVYCKCVACMLLWILGVD